MNKKLYLENIIDTWVEPNETDDKIHERYKELNKIVTPMYDFILSYSNYYNTRRDYGNGMLSTMIEIHILTDIYDYNNITVSDLADKWRRSNSAISQIVRRLIGKNLVTRKNSEQDAKIFYLECTNDGKSLVTLHKKYDNLDIIKTRKKLLEKFTIDELVAFDQICLEYTKILRENTSDTDK
ncbi:MarR family transcriptional regulator [Peptoniphilus indolicus]|uniref:MarR family transcriptional regulator n=2 Tax=Peptoniphilus indolicus TaxID=33030 RepID=G4D183_9FIRM|nr:MarR family transcriptional regulator [Peptoniphilus indolicus]EGY80717.1 MarR family transcriptional regulator [Peptoniphilus indolicus ATCC 29427]SUB74866.1 MarR family [Peptoniphilus indolicus]